MACEISPICNFLFGSIRTNLPTDTVDVEQTVQMVKGNYTYMNLNLNINFINFIITLSI